MLDENFKKPLEEFLFSVRDIDGFPIAEDENILDLSDPPFYTACPNPYINEFIDIYGKKYDKDTDYYDKKPFAGDISEGKTDSIYMAHSYHTKVPHKAIMKFINHYTKQGDIVFDGFCGTGMTGVASQLAGRIPILTEISPIASFIAYNYNNSIYTAELEMQTADLIKNVKRESSWLYKTLHKHDNLTGEKIYGSINYVIWSEVLICPYCKQQYVFWDLAIDSDTKKVLKEYKCKSCDSNITKKVSPKVTEKSSNSEFETAKEVPVLINYSYGNKRYEKIPDDYDYDVIKEIMELEIPYWYPNDPMMFKGERWGDSWRKGYHFGMTNVNHFFYKRTLYVLSCLYSEIQKAELNKQILLLYFTSILQRSSKLFRWSKNQAGPLSGTLYIASLTFETSVFNLLHNKSSLIKTLKKNSKNYCNGFLISTQSTVDLSNIPPDSVDYIFTDPPFGDNLMYSELNFIWESWLKVFTNNQTEAIVNQSQNKGLEEYTDLMTKCFKEMYRILKPKRWLTIVFHNSRASVWNSIQEGITRAGFIISQVTTLDKKQGSFKQVTASGAVKNDLIINAYKPENKFSDKFLKNAGEGMEIDFVREQLKHLPVRPNIGRTEQMLYSKTLAHYVENGFKIKYNSKNFYKLLLDNFTELDGYWFLSSQVREYNEWKSGLSLDQLKKILDGQQVLLVLDERTAITWIYNHLHQPSEYGDIYTAYQQVATKTSDQIPELKEILDNNFIIENGKYRRPLSEQEREEINKNRENELDRAFNKLLTQARTKKSKIKEVRLEALIHGFTKCYQEGKYQDIITIADKLYAGTLESSGDIMDFVDIAKIKTSGQEKL